MLHFIRVLWEDFKAHRRGERRIAPRSVQRGRVYARKDEPSSPGYARPRAEPKATLQMRVIRANGSVEHVEAPATAEFIPSTEQEPGNG